MNKVEQIACLDARLNTCEYRIYELYEELKKRNKKRRRRFVK